jgi:predicted transcriptional regulator
MKSKLTLRLDEDLKERAKQLADRRGTSVSKIVEPSTSRFSSRRMIRSRKAQRKDPLRSLATDRRWTDRRQADPHRLESPQMRIIQEEHPRGDRSLPGSVSSKRSSESLLPK